MCLIKFIKNNYIFFDISNNLIESVPILKGHYVISYRI